MQMRHTEMRPGKVLKVEDNYGTIKASCAGYFSADDDPELLPPIIPLFKTSSTSFCSPHEGDDVFIWLDKTNPQELYYTFQGAVEQQNKDELEYGSNHTEIVSRYKHSDDTTSSIVYTEEDGWKIGDKTSGIVVNDEGGVDLQQGDYAYSVRVTDDGIIMSDKKSNHAEPAVLGDSLEDALNALVNLLETIQSVAAGSPYTASIAGAISSQLPIVKSRIKQIKSKNVKLN